MRVISLTDERWIIKPRKLFTVPILDQEFGVGMKKDYTWMVHFFLYGLITLICSLLFGAKFGLGIGIGAVTATEVTDGLRFHFDNRNYFGLGDFPIGIAGVVLVFLLII